MRKFFTIFISTVAMLAFASVALAADTRLSGADVSAVWAAASFAMAIAAFGCGIGQALGLKAACEGTARNPEAGGKIMVTLILGMAFIESLAIYALVVNLILLSR